MFIFMVIIMFYILLRTMHFLIELTKRNSLEYRELYEEEAERKRMKKAKKQKTDVQTKITFGKSSVISKQLAIFLNKPENTDISKSDATKKVCDYIKNNNLQNSKNKTQIQPDITLANLLKPLESKDIMKGYTYFNIGKYLEHHFRNNNNKEKISSPLKNRFSRRIRNLEPIYKGI